MMLINIFVYETILDKFKMAAKFKMSANSLTENMHNPECVVQSESYCPKKSFTRVQK